MASWQHVALGAVAAAGVGLALYHAKNRKTEEALEKERTKLYHDARTGNARFVQRMTDPVKTRDKWRSMDLHERKAAFLIDREQLAQSYTRNLRYITGKRIPDPVFVNENVIKYATAAFKQSLERGIPVVSIPPTDRPSEILEYRAVVEMLEEQLDDGLTVPMVQFRKAAGSWQVLKALDVVWSSLTLRMVFSIYVYLIILWFGLGMLDHVVGTRLGMFGLPSYLWRASGFSYVMSTLSYLRISRPFSFLWSWTVQPLTNMPLSQMIGNTVGSHVVEFFVLFLAHYLYCAQIGIITGLVCAFCEFLAAKILGMFSLLLYVIWTGMFVKGVYCTLAVVLKSLVTVLSLWNRAGQVMSHQYQPEMPLMLKEGRKIATCGSLLPFERPSHCDCCNHDYSYDNYDDDDTDSSQDCVVEEYILSYTEFLARHNSGSACSYCHKEPKPGQKLKLCSGCKKKRYCNQKCQEYHWITHKANCTNSSKKKKRNRRR